MDFFRNDQSIEDENWQYMEISKINNKIIRKLVKNLEKDLSDDFFLSVNSLLKIGKKAESELRQSLSELNERNNFRKEIFNIILNFFKNDTIKSPQILKLYHPDFIIRAKTIMAIEENQDSSYLKYILPLIGDPDDSVRWAVLKYIISLDQARNPKVLKKFKKRIKMELNPIIQNKLIEIIEDLD